MEYINKTFRITKETDKIFRELKESLGISQSETLRRLVSNFNKFRQDNS
ncbi:MAG: ribbon-helix-helix protein, CopG family [Patescibacteria group bacterium]|jgi:hypothetical protein|nr:ribbon-helix-helix protein, CopG family [Patescibacteria group bacterium]